MANLTTADILRHGIESAFRFQRRLRAKLNVLPNMPQATIVFHEGYEGIERSAGDIERNVADHERAQKILNYLCYEGCMDASQIVTPKTATINQLSLIHDFSYLSQLNEPEVGERIFGQGLSADMQRAGVEQQRLMTGGTIRAARMAISNVYPRRIINLGGGFHHAYPEGGYAFCVFNDVAIAVDHLRKHGFDKPILIIDLDLHQGDGTKKIFEHDKSVVTYSVHAETWYEAEAEANYDIALGPGIGDVAYLNAIRSTLPNVVHRVQPGLVFYLAGVDVAEDDELGDWRISHDGIFARDCLVDQIVGKRRMVVVTAGGYGRNAWRHTARFCGYLTAKLTKPIASDNERLMWFMRRLSKTFQVHDLTSDQNENEDDDFFGLFSGQTTKRTRLFDYYSYYGVECALERVGVFEHLRKLGFVSPRLEFDLDHPNGQAIRLFADEAKKILLVEAVLDEKTTANNQKLLWIEWLLLQNPTHSPSAERLLLPGQTHPGLGCLHRIVGLLFLVCVRLKFDSIGFNPAHYHVCSLARGQGYFENPADEAHYRVAQALTSGMSLQQASQMLCDGIRHGAQIFKWVPARMIIPISASAKAYPRSADYQREVEKIAAIEFKKFGRSRHHRQNKPN
ncbi:MAG: histone deacetylase [Proteobacteria bacterium]|nr:histone deacetylase [Pseudomonadota bacterium]